MMRPGPALPEPDADAREHSARVAAHIRGEIARNGGFIPFSRYMELALYAPGLGYYVSGARRFGASGDFITGPELTPLYGAAMAAQIEAIHDSVGGREIVELGAGTGALASAVLGALAARGEAPVRYRILEVSPALRAQQRQTIGAGSDDGLARVDWLERLPASIHGVVIMNEVLDAIAPQVIARRAGRWFERGVTSIDGELAWDERPLEDAALRALAQARFPPGGDYQSEVNPAAEALVATLTRRLASGAMLIVDYGFPRAEYYHPQRSRGTLVGHYRHRVHADPFVWPGLSDLTSHVDFTAMADAGKRAGATVAAFATQASFLLGCGILDLLRGAGPPTGARYLREASAIQKLVSPAEMGELFKVLMLSRGDGDWPSLAVTDMAHRL